MPFTQPYIGWYTPGDLIYGLAPMRQTLTLHFGAAIIGGTGQPVTVDQYRKSYMDTRQKSERVEWKAFLRANENHPRYQGYGQQVRRYNSDEELFARREPNAELHNAAWRDKSKFGMEWTLSGNRGIIHFVLDGIDMGAVVSKTHNFTDANGNVLARDLPHGKAPAGAGKERTVTHSELRWIYRARTNPVVAAGVQFWLSNAHGISPCSPPWTNAHQNTVVPNHGAMTWAQAWATYVPTTMRPNF